MITLRAKTRKGKNILANHGTIWTVEHNENTVIFTDKIGPWLLLTAGTDWRWVHETDDENFEVEGLRADSDLLK